MGDNLNKKNPSEKVLVETVKELKNSRIHETLLNGFDDKTIISITDSTGNILYCNEAYSRISKYQKNELIGKNQRIVNSGYHDKSHFAELWQTIQSGKVWRGEICNRTKDGDLYWVDSSIFPAISENGETVHYLAILHDITEKKQNDKIFELLNCIHDQYMAEGVDQRTLFNSLMSSVLKTLDSEYGFIGKIVTGEDGNKYLKTFALTNIAWNSETQKLYREKTEAGFEFKNLNSLYGWSIINAQPVITNDPSKDNRSGGLPPGHPALKSYMGVPLFSGGEFIGMLGVANRKCGYSKALYKKYALVWQVLGTIVSDSIIRSQERLLNQNLKSLVSSMNDIVFELDEEFRYINAWASNEEAFFIPREKFLGKTITEVYGDTEYAKPMVEAVSYVFKTGRPFTLEYQPPFESNLWYSAKISKMNSQQSSKPRVAVVVSDITALKNTEAERDLQKAKAIQASKMAALGEMAGGVAHEINNPLAIIDGSSSILQRLIEQPEPDRKQIQNLVEKIRKTTARIAAIIKGLRSFARDSESDPYISTPLKQIVDDTLGFCEARLKSRGIGLRMKYQSENLHCECRGVQISQILLNFYST